MAHIVRSATQVDVANSVTNGPSITLNGVADQNAIVALASIWRNDVSSTLNSVTDGGNAYTLLQALATNGATDRSRAAAAYANKVTGGNRTITFNMSSSVATYYVLGAVECAGMFQGNLLDASSSNQNIDVSGAVDASAGAITTRRAAELIIGVASVNASSAALSFASPANWVNLYRQNDSTTYIGMDAGYWLPNAVQNGYNPQWSHANVASATAGAVVLALFSFDAFGSARPPVGRGDGRNIEAIEEQAAGDWFGADDTQPAAWFDPDYIVATGGANTFTYTASGGITTGGAAAVLKQKVVTGAGGAQTGGAAPVLKQKVVTGAGGIQTGGAATVSKTKAAQVSGGVTTGGAAAVLKQKVVTGAGGVTTSGAAPVLKEKVLSGSGGITTGGAATTSLVTGAQTYTYTASGGITTGGVGAVLKQKVVTGAGGAQTGGAAPIVKEKVVSAAGGAQTGGAATTSFQRIFSYTASGGVSTGGAATVSKTKVPQIAGGVTTSGAAPVLKQKVVAATGGAQTGGAATTLFQSAGAQTFTYTPSGGGQTGGAAVTQYTPATVAKGGDWNRLWRPPSAPRLVTGSGGIHVGGAAVVAFAPARVAKRPKPAPRPQPQRTAVLYVYTGRGSVHAGGAAETAAHDHVAHVHRVDLLDMGLAA